MLAHGFWLGAVMVLTAAKVVSLGVTAFIFDLTRPKLLELPWFRRFYEHMIVWLAKAHELAIDQGTHQAHDAGVRAQSRRPHVCAPDPHFRRRMRLRAAAEQRRDQNKCTAWGAKKPIAVEDHPDNAKTRGRIGKRQHAGDHRRGREHHADLVDRGSDTRS